MTLHKIGLNERIITLNINSSSERFCSEKRFRIWMKSDKTSDSVFDEPEVVKEFYTSSPLYTYSSRKSCMCSYRYLKFRRIRSHCWDFFPMLWGNQKKDWANIKTLKARAVIDHWLPNPAHCPMVIDKISSEYFEQKALSSSLLRWKKCRESNKYIDRKSKEKTFFFD